MTNPVTYKTDLELVDYVTSSPPAVQAEFMRRQTQILREGGEHQKRAADAMVETAVATKANARYMLWSVVVLAVASVLNLIVTFVHSSN
jgi:hypothetical protein